MDITIEKSKPEFLDVLYANEVEGNNFSYAVCLLSCILFNLNTHLVLTRVAPDSARKTPAQLWKWRNTTNSLIHSFLSGTWALLNFWKTPELRHNLITAYTKSSLALVSFSVGYFIYDFFDMASNQRRRSTYELLLHHVLVMMCFGTSMITRYYQGYTLVALLIEINSVFLHIRQLFIIQGWKKNGIAYKVNSYLNLGTFVVFRLINLGWLIRWLAVNKDVLSAGISTLGYTAGAQIFFFVHSIRLLKKILKSDRFLFTDAPAGSQSPRDWDNLSRTSLAF